MEKIFTVACLLLASFTTPAQVTQINSNKSLQPVYPLNSTKTIAVSDIDTSIWVTDGTLAGTIQISGTIKLDDAIGLLAGKLIFRGSTAATGAELYSTDGTPGGTALLKDIYTGPSGSFPSDFALLNGVAYFFAETAAEGRELWKTDGTSAGTSLVKDIVAGPASSNFEDGYEMFATGSYLLFRANTVADGLELWKSDGTNAGTALLKNINTGADSSSPHYFFILGSSVLFMARDATHGEELWKTDGTANGTLMVKDIYTGLASSTLIELFPGFGFPVFQGFHAFNNKVYFRATDGVSAAELWATDGSAGGTVLVKDIVPGSMVPSVISVANAVNLSNKFMFSVSDVATFSQLWQSDGTNAGTTLFRDFSIANNDYPAILVNYQYRCNITGNFSATSTLKFISKWKGTASNLWNNPANWSCNALPDANTDVIINAGTAVLNVNGTCRSISVSAGAGFTVNTGFTLQVVQ